MHRAVCLFASQLLLVLIAPAHGGLARLSWIIILREAIYICYYNIGFCHLLAGVLWNRSKAVA